MLVACPACATKNNLPEISNDKRLYRCDKCKAKITIPAQNSPPESVSQQTSINQPMELSMDNGLIDIWLTPNDIALIVNCLDWVLEYIESTDTDYKKLDTRIHEMLANKLPSDAFSRLIPMIRLAEKNVLMHSIGHYDAIHDSEGKNQLQKRLSDLDKSTTEIQRFKDVVAIGTSVSTMSHRTR